MDLNISIIFSISKDNIFQSYEIIWNQKYAKVTYSNFYCSIGFTDNTGLYSSGLRSAK
nr:hypothetical protein KV8917_900027 [Klebsiella variicola]